jgi:hypothetical protein
VTTIGESAFRKCSGLTGTLTLPNSVTYIGWGTFADCSGLTDLTIPNSVKTIGREAFYGCIGLVSINVNAGNSAYSSANGILFNKDKTTLVIYPGGKTGSYAIPNSVTTIGEYAFSGCTGLTSVTIGNSAQTIGDYAFYHCSGLTSITIGNSVKTIGNQAFVGCSNLTNMTLDMTTIPSARGGVWGNDEFSHWQGSSLTSLTLGNSVTTIYSYAFSGCTSLTEVTIGNSVTTIYSYAFSGCTDLTNVTSLNPVPPTLGNSTVFENTNVGNGTLRVPSSAVNAYKWSSWYDYFGSIVKL